MSAMNPLCSAPSRLPRAADVEVLPMAMLNPEQVGKSSSMARRRRRASGRQQFVGRRKQVTVALLVRTPHAAARLVQVAQTEVFGRCRR